MGLDISVYNNLQFITEDENYDDDYDVYVFVIDPDWGDRIKNFKVGYYKAEYLEHGPSLPYSSHGEFRKSLCKLLNVDIDDVWSGKHPDIPFIELIDFADNEGCLDYEVAEELYKDFVEHRDKFLEMEEKAEFYNGIYDEWLHVCKSASENKGVIRFS